MCVYVCEHVRVRVPAHGLMQSDVPLTHLRTSSVLSLHCHLCAIHLCVCVCVCVCVCFCVGVGVCNSLSRRSACRRQAWVLFSGPAASLVHLPFTPCFAGRLRACVRAFACAHVFASLHMCVGGGGRRWSCVGLCVRACVAFLFFCLLPLFLLFPFFRSASSFFLLFFLLLSFCSCVLPCPQSMMRAPLRGVVMKRVRAWWCVPSVHGAEPTCFSMPVCSRVGLLWW
jgi:hypothetical protein